MSNFELHTTVRVNATGVVHLPRGDRATARVHREWLKKLPTITGKPLTRLAREINIAPSTLTRPLKDGENGTSTLHANTIAKVVSHTGAPPPATIGAAPPGRRTARGFGEDAVPYTPIENDPILAMLRAIAGPRNSLAPWLLNSRAVELAGFLPGDVLVLDVNATPAPGDLVCAQVHWPRPRAETVVRVYERAPPVELLVTRSLDPGLQVPLVVDGERVIIMGVFLPHRLRAAA